MADKLKSQKHKLKISSIFVLLRFLYYYVVMLLCVSIIVLFYIIAFICVFYCVCAFAINDY